MTQKKYIIPKLSLVETATPPKLNLYKVSGSTTIQIIVNRSTFNIMLQRSIIITIVF